jgi:hypothetical protein
MFMCWFFFIIIIEGCELKVYEFLFDVAHGLEWLIQ